MVVCWLEEFEREWGKRVLKKGMVVFSMIRCYCLLGFVFFVVGYVCFLVWIE